MGERRAVLLPTSKPICLNVSGRDGSQTFRGALHAIHRQQRLMRIEVKLQWDGEITVREQLLAEKVPVTMVTP